MGSSAIRLNPKEMLHLSVGDCPSSRHIFPGGPGSGNRDGENKGVSWPVGETALFDFDQRKNKNKVLFGEIIKGFLCSMSVFLTLL